MAFSGALRFIKPPSYEEGKIIGELFLSEAAYHTASLSELWKYGTIYWIYDMNMTMFTMDFR
jgi:hypothetical protein